MLQEILSDREHTGAVILEQLDTATDPWGILVERVEVKDVRLPQNLQRAMAAEAEASREARAKVCFRSTVFPKNLLLTKGKLKEVPL